MKIALCLSGQPRFFERGFEYIKKYIIEPNDDIDIFCHLWFDESDIGKNGYSNTSGTLKKDGYFGDIIKENTSKKIKLLYNPKKLLSEKQFDCSVFIKKDYVSRSANVITKDYLTNPFATFSNYLSSHKSLQLKNEYEIKNNFEYDVVIKCRYDIIMDKPLVINDVGNIIIFHNDVNHPTKLIFNDGIFYGNNKLMTKLISESYLKFDEYSLDDSLVWNNHHLLGKYVKDNNIVYKKINLGNIRWIRR